MRIFIGTIVLGIALLSGSCGKGFDSSDSAAVTPVNWFFLDGNGNDGINKSASSQAYTPQLYTYSSKLYATWSEAASGYYQIRVAVFNNNDSSPQWTFVDGALSSGINKNSLKDASNPQLMQAYGKLYAAWNETSPDGVQQIRIAEYNGNDGSPSWTFVDGNGSYGLNYNAIYSATTPVMAYFGGNLYAAWSEATSGTNRHIRVALFNGNSGSPSWTWVDANGSDGLILDSSQSATAPQFVVSNDLLLVTWSETRASGTLVRVAYYNGSDTSPSWTLMDGTTAKGLNQSSSNTASTPQLLMHLNHLYAVWSESYNFYPTQIRAARLFGSETNPVWTFLDSGGSSGINYDASVLAVQPRLLSHASRLYSAWAENNGTASQIRVKVFNDNFSSPGWNSVDGSQSYGLNKASNKNAYTPSPVSFMGKIYLGWSETNVNGVSQIRVTVGK